MNRLFYYLKIWFLMSRNSFMNYAFNKLGFSIFLTGKILRFAVYFIFLFFLLQGAKSLAGYNQNQTLFFFLTFVLIDTVSQFLFREVYRFRSYITTGEFDLVLVKPASALFRSLLGGADVIDLATIPPLLAILWVVGQSLSPNFLSVILYILLVASSILISAAFHIVVISFGIITLEIDHTVMIYRDLTSLGRFPIDIYKEPLRGALTFIIPVGVMMSYPAKALFGILSPLGVLTSIAFGVGFMFVALRFWALALKSYTSASS